MKKLNLLLISAGLISCVVTSCKKSAPVAPSTGALGANYPRVLNSIVTPPIVDTFRSHGFIINEGTTPPTVNGIYYLSPDECFYDNSAPNAGKIFTGYQYQFINQDNSAYTVTVNYSNAIVGGTDKGTDGSASYISGNGSAFTVYAQVTGTLSGVTYKELQVLSGSLETGGIKNFEWGFLMVSKTSDPGDKAVVPVGTIRLFKDQDGTSESQTTLDVVAKNFIQNSGQPEFRSLAAAAAKQN